jgi:hypothetical protein
MGTVDDLQSFSDAAEKNGMLAYNVSRPDHLHSDFLVGSFSNHPLSSVDANLIEISSNRIRN